MSAIRRRSAESADTIGGAAQSCGHLRNTNVTNMLMRRQVCNPEKTEKNTQEPHRNAQRASLLPGLDDAEERHSVGAAEPVQRCCQPAAVQTDVPVGLGHCFLRHFLHLYRHRSAAGRTGSDPLLLLLLLRHCRQASPDQSRGGQLCAGTIRHGSGDRDGSRREKHDSTLLTCANLYKNNNDARHRAKLINLVICQENYHHSA